MAGNKQPKGNMRPIIRGKSTDHSPQGKEECIVGGMASSDVSDLMFIDQIQNDDLRTLYMDEFRKDCELRRSIVQTSCANEEARITRQNESDITIRQRSQMFGLFFIVAVLGAFVYCEYLHVPASCLWPFSIFFAGTVILFISGHRKKSSESEKSSQKGQENSRE